MKISVHRIIVLACSSIFYVLLSYGQTSGRESILVKGSIVGHSTVRNNKVAVIIGQDTAKSSTDNNGNFEINASGKFNFNRPTLATLLYPLDRLEDQDKKDTLVQYFFLDTNTITIRIDPKQEIIEAHGGYENTVNAAFLILDKQYLSNIKNKSKTVKITNIDSLSRAYYMSVLDLATKYNRSLSTYNKLFSLFRPTAFPLRDNIHATIEALDKNYFTTEEKDAINNAYLTFIKKNSDKLNDALWPNLQYITHESPDFTTLQSAYDYILIDIWATWCGPCIQQHPHIKKLAAKYATKNRFKIIGIAILCKKEDWEKHLTANPTGYFNYWLDKTNSDQLAQQIKIIEVPRYVLLRTSDNTLVEKRIPFDKIEEVMKKYDIK